MSINSLATDWYRCTKCKKSYLVDINAPGHRGDLLKKSMRCPDSKTCSGNIRLRAWNDSSELELKKWGLMWVTAIDLFQAVAGLGLAAERKCSPNELKKLMTGSRIMSLELAKSHDPQKSILTSLQLDNGKVIHFASSTMGAIVYKVTEA